MLELARLARRVEAALGDGSQPQDIEWAHDGERFCLVQARPVVKVPRPSGVRRFPTMWSNANVTEGLPSVVSELAWSGTSTLVNRQFFSLLAATGYTVPRGIECVRRIHGRAYIDLTLMQWLYYDALGVLPADLNVLTGGLQPALTLPEDPFAGEPGRRRRLANLRLLPKLLLSRWRYPGRIARFLEESQGLAGQDFSALNAGELLDLCTREAGRVQTFFPSFMMGNANPELTLLCQLIERWIKGRGYAIAGALMAGLGKVVSADHGTALYGLARAAQADPPAHALLMEPGRAAAEWRSLAAGSRFKRAFEGFLAEYGHRAVGECDVANPRWQEDPRFVFEQLRPLLTSEPAHDVNARAMRARRGAEVALIKVPFIVRPVLRWLARRAQRNAALREAAKSALMAALLVTRRLALVIGERLAKASLIEDRDDVFFLNWSDVTAYLRGEWGGESPRQLIVDRKERHAKWLSTPALSVYAEARARWHGGDVRWWPRPRVPLKALPTKFRACWALASLREGLAGAPGWCAPPTRRRVWRRARFSSRLRPTRVGRRCSCARARSRSRSGAISRTPPSLPANMDCRLWSMSQDSSTRWSTARRSSLTAISGW